MRFVRVQTKKKEIMISKGARSAAPRGEALAVRARSVAPPPRRVRADAAASARIRTCADTGFVMMVVQGTVQPE
jgi:hypothetical protein